MPSLDSLYRRNASQWPAYYQNKRTILGNTGTLVNFGDQDLAGLINATTYVGKKFNASGLSPTWTPSAALSALATSMDLTLAANWQGLAPIGTLNGTSEHFGSAPDAAYWTSALTSFSVGAWCYLTSVAASRIIFTKWDDTTAATKREWSLYLPSGKINLLVSDETNNATVGRSYNTALVINRWHHIVATYGAGTTDASCKLYLNGAQVDDTNIGAGVFVTMRDTASQPYIGTYIGTGGTLALYYSGKMAGGPFGPFFAQIALTVEQIKDLYDLERLGMGV